MSGFGKATYDLNLCQLRFPNPEDAELLASVLSKIEPWKTLNSTADGLKKGFFHQDSSTHTYAVILDDEPVGIISIRYPWLLGPYLGFLGIVPQAQGRGLGKVLMNWLEETAKEHSARNIFICVSDFNKEAQNFYQSCGYEKVAHLDGLIVDQHAELLLRKRLS